MGIRLLVEVLDYAPTTLTHREKLVLAVLAENAPDETRVTWSSVESPEILRRGKVTRPQMYEVLRSLVAKGALKRLTAGQKNASAKYTILALAPAQCPQIPDPEAPVKCPGFPDTDTPQRPGTPDTDAPAQGPEIPDTDEPQCPQIPDTDESQCPEIASLSVRESRTPTPQYPSTTRERSIEAPAPHGIPDCARALVDQMSLADINVRWPFRAGEWLQLDAAIQKSGVPALVDYARRVYERRHGDVDSARYFLQGWSELAPQPAPGTERPPLRAVPSTGGAASWQPYTNPDPSVYRNGWS